MQPRKADVGWSNVNYTSLSYVMKSQAQNLVKSASKKTWKSHAGELKSVSQACPIFSGFF